MTDTVLSPQDVAHFLKRNPEFFSDHASLFADLRIPHPHQPGAISLGERQILTLRTRMRELEHHLAGLIHNATGNQRISQLLIDWCATLLATQSAWQIPDRLVQGLAQVFSLPDIALRLWNLPELGADNPWAAAVSATLQGETDARSEPWCGPASEQPEAAGWLPNAPESVALLPLTLGTPPRTLGLLVLGSPEPERFASDMGTEFLQTIATLSSAALSRLADPGEPESA